MRRQLHGLSCTPAAISESELVLPGHDLADDEVDLILAEAPFERQVVAIARAIHFNAKILIMDEPTAALGPSETVMVAELTQQLRSEGIAIFLVSHDLHDVFDLCDRIMVMKNGVNVGTHPIGHVTKDDVLSLIIVGKLPDDWSPRDGS